MTSYFRERHTARKLWLAAAALAAVLVLAACGMTTSPGVGGGLQSSPPTSANATATSVKNTPASMTTAHGTTGGSGAMGLGCTGPTSISVANAQVMLQPTQMNAATTVAVGQSVGVNLPAKFHWTLRVKDPTGALTLTTPLGILDTAHNTCDWRFDAAHTGTVTISFVGIFKCAPNSMCPEIALDYSYPLNIH